ncbi:MAG: hypothetical protein AB7I04_07555 [Pseudomonadales bacterium]
MKHLAGTVVWMAALVAGSGSVAADSLEGADRLLCSPVEVIACTGDGVCEAEIPAELGIPPFVVVDLKKKLLSTTAASSEQRSTPVERVTRADGLIVLHGQERGRAFTWLMDEASGRVSLATVRDSVVVNVFGACTPADGR